MAEAEKGIAASDFPDPEKYAGAHHMNLGHAAKLVQEMEIVLPVSSTELVVVTGKKPCLSFP